MEPLISVMISNLLKFDLATMVWYVSKLTVLETISRLRVSLECVTNRWGYYL